MPDIDDMWDDEADMAQFAKPAPERDSSVANLGKTVTAIERDSRAKLRAKINELVEDALVDAEVDFPAGREAGARVVVDTEALMDKIMAAIAGGV